MGTNNKRVLKCIYAKRKEKIKTVANIAKKQINSNIIFAQNLT